MQPPHVQLAPLSVCSHRTAEAPDPVRQLQIGAADRAPPAMAAVPDLHPGAIAWRLTRSLSAAIDLLFALGARPASPNIPAASSSRLSRHCLIYSSWTSKSSTRSTGCPPPLIAYNVTISKMTYATSCNLNLSHAQICFLKHVIAARKARISAVQRPRGASLTAGPVSVDA
jgi:hypothetical protein